MKTLLRGALAAASMIAMAGAAQAQITTHNVTATPGNSSLTRTVVTPTQGNWANNNPNNFTPCPNANANCFSGVKNVTSTVTDATFAISGTSPDNEDAATGTSNLTSVYSLTGTVSSDCSFYGQGNQSINLGTLGIRTSNNNAVGNMFNLRQAATVKIATSAAGCNTANKVTIAKDSDQGLRNADAGVGFDNTQFQNNLRYAVAASYSGASSATGGSQGNSPLGFTVGEGDLDGERTSGAWRSAFELNLTTEVPSKGLVAGTYNGTLTVTLAATL